MTPKPPSTAVRNSAAGDVLVDRSGRVLHVTLNRPDKHNPLSRAVLARLGHVFRQARDEPELACAVVTGAGARYFAAGGDLRDLAHVRAEADVRAMAEEARDALDAIREFPLPVVALLNGDAIGGGAELAVACDFRIARAGAAIGYVHGRLEITSAWGGGTDLIALIGRSRALQMMARGERIGADEALQWGLVDRVAAPESLESALQEFTAPMLAHGAAVLRGAKAQIVAARRGLSYAERRAVELDAFVRTWIHPDHWAALERVLPAPPGS